MRASLNESRGDAILGRILAILLNPWFLAAASAILLLLVSLELASLIDEAIWEYSAWLWAVHGDPPYVGSFENKPAGIFLLYRLSYAIFGLSLWPARLLSVAAMVATLLLLHAIGKRYQGRIAGAMSALIFSLAMAHHVTDGYMLAVTETFMVFFTTTVFYGLSSVYWHRPKRASPRLMLGVGAALGAALCFKQIALADMIGLIPMYWMATRQSASLRGVLRDVLLMLLAGGAVTMLSLLPLLAGGVTLRDYWNGAWGILFHQSGALSAGERLKLMFSTWTDPGLTVFYPLVLLFVFQKTRLQKAGVPFWCLLFWLGMAFVGANASNVYKHQIKQVMAPLSLVAGLGIGISFKTVAGFASWWLLWLYLSIVAAMVPLNSVLIGIAKHTMPRVMPCPGAVEERTDRRLAEYIRANTAPSECIYVWALNSHPIHLYAERRSSSRYFNAIFHFAPDFEATTAADLVARPPKLIFIKDPTDKLPPPPACVSRLLAESYRPACRIDCFQVYEQSLPKGQ